MNCLRLCVCVLQPVKSKSTFIASSSPSYQHFPLPSCLYLSDPLIIHFCSPKPSTSSVLPLLNTFQNEDSNGLHSCRTGCQTKYVNCQSTSLSVTCIFLDAFLTLTGLYLIAKHCWVAPGGQKWAKKKEDTTVHFLHDGKLWYQKKTFFTVSHLLTPNCLFHVKR